MATTRRRVLHTGLPPLVGSVPGVVVLLREWDRLPARIASHFDFGGTADALAGRGAVLAVQLGTSVGLAVLLGGIAATGPARRTTGFDPWRLLAGVAWGAAVLVGGAFLFSALAVADAPEPLAARLSPMAFPVVLVLAVLAGVVGAALLPATPLQPGADAPTRAIPFAEGERVSWSGTCSSWPVTAMAAVLLLTGLVLLGRPAAGIPLAVAGAALLLLGSARTTVDRHGLTVALGVLGFPRLRVPLDEIDSVSATDVAALQFGGWGYRLVPGGAGVIVRSGPALVVTRRSGRRLTVTVDDAATAAGVLAGLRERTC
jgi:hypothetical protein